jgi:hypothetical protein
MTHLQGELVMPKKCMNARAPRPQVRNGGLGPFSFARLKVVILFVLSVVVGGRCRTPCYKRQDGRA